MSAFSAFVIGCSGYKKKVADPVRREKYIEKLRSKNEKPYRAPVFPYRSGLEEGVFDNTQVYYFNKGSKRKIVYLHGGAYCEQPLLPHFVFCDTVAKKTDSTVILPVYKKAPNYTFETTFNTLKKLYSELLADRDTDEILFMGDSSGGGLCLAFCEYLNEIGLPQPKRMILISPWLDASMDKPFLKEFDKKDPSLQREFLRRAGRNWAGDTDVHDYRISPIYGDLSALAPMTVYYGTYEAIVVDGRDFRKRCEKAGAELDYREYEGMNHCFPIYPIPEAKKAQKEIIDIING
jgi:acetyl esterase/lipase